MLYQCCNEVRTFHVQEVWKIIDILILKLANDFYLLLRAKVQGQLTVKLYFKCVLQKIKKSEYHLTLWNRDHHRKQITMFYLTWSEMVNLTAVTTVVLINGDGELRDRFNLGKRLAGSINVSLPKHSATTFLVPSSTHSQWRYNCCHIAGTNGSSCWMPAGVCDRQVITCKVY